MRARRFALSLSMVLAVTLAAGTAQAAMDTFDPHGLAPVEPAPTLTRVQPPRPKHANPRLKVSYRSLSMANLDRTAMHFDAGQLDIYAMSRRWVRIGIEAEGGAGKATLSGYSTGIYYGALGLTAGIQYPWRVTPFVEGRFAGGVLGGNFMNTTVVTYAYMGGIDAGIELYTFGRLYVTASVGWVHPVYHAIDYAAARATPASIKFVDIASDAFTFKVGFGI